MIIITNYIEKYKEKIYNFIYNTISEELNVNKSMLGVITTDLKDIQGNYLDKNGCFWLALDDETDEIIGTIAIVENGKGIGELKRFYVKKEYRHEKIGYKLYRLVEEYVTSKCFDELYLVSGRELTSAHKFYERNGWKKANHKIDKVNMYVRKNADLYRKKLKIETQDEFCTTFILKKEEVYSRVA